MTADDGKRRRKLSDDERVLWGQVTRLVAPLKRKPIKAAQPDAGPATPIARPAPSKAKPASTATLVPRAKPAPKPAPPLAPLDRRHKKRLGRCAVQLDGSTTAFAHFRHGDETKSYKPTYVIVKSLDLHA